MYETSLREAAAVFDAIRTEIDPTLQDWENDAAPIGCPAAVEVVLRKLEAQRDVEETVHLHLN